MDIHEKMQQSEDYLKIEKALTFIETNFRRQPSLDEIARSVHLSKYHFDRLFKRWAGISPKQFLQFITLGYTKACLAHQISLQETALAAGLSGSGRLHDLFVTFEAMTPGQYRNQGQGLQIEYGFAPSPFGVCLLAATSRGICHLGFAVPNAEETAVQQLRDAWPDARLLERPGQFDTLAEQIFTPSPTAKQPFNLHLKGTNFQIQVWKALLQIPSGHMVSYSEVARHLGKPAAFRAVASAIALNPVGYLIPCHRVINASGRINKYRWGAVRKQAILGWEAAHTQTEIMPPCSTPARQNSPRRK